MSNLAWGFKFPTVLSLCKTDWRLFAKGNLLQKQGECYTNRCGGTLYREWRDSALSADSRTECRGAWVTTYLAILSVLHGYLWGCGLIKQEKGEYC